MHIRDFLLVLLLAATTSSAASVSFPLGGIYRPGRYMPVEVEYGNERGVIRLTADGALETSIELGSAGHVTVPWLVVSGVIQNAKWFDSAGQSHALPTSLEAAAEQGRIVGLVGVDARIANAVFPKARVIPIALDAAWTAEPAAAWETLDAVVLDAGAPILRNSEVLDQLLLTGMTIGVVASEPPAAHHDEWTQSGSLWLLRHPPMIFHDPINAEAYGPTYDWIRGRTPADRARVVIFAIGISIVVIMIALWRSRWAVWAIVAFCLIGIGICFIYDRNRSNMLWLPLGVTDGSTFDAWSWYSPIRNADGSHDFSDFSKPVFASVAQSRELPIVLNWPERSFTFHLDRGQSLAFVDIHPADPINNALPQVLPTAQDFVEHLYLHTGDRILGTGRINHLDAVVIGHPRSPAAN